MDDRTKEIQKICQAWLEEVLKLMILRECYRVPRIHKTEQCKCFEASWFD